MQEVETFPENSNKPEKNIRIHEDDLLAYISGGTELDDETYWTIANERKQDGSPIHKWFQEFYAKCRDPLNIDWLQIGSVDEETTEGSEK